MNGQRGQASIEAIAGIAALTLTGLLCLQLLAAGYAQTLADGAAEAGAIAAGEGRPAGAAARNALPGWGRMRVEVTQLGTRVRVRLRPPSVFRAVSERLAVSSQADGGPR